MTKNKAIPIFFLTAGFLWAGIAQAQENANTSGGVATGSGGTVAYSIGQVAYTTNTGSNGSVECNMPTKFSQLALRKQS
jgi:TRAP-type uncharacterized transport system substrate-binding protein